MKLFNGAMPLQLRAPPLLSAEIEGLKNLGRRAGRAPLLAQRSEC